jgi:CubicO group peptidase (beta-lactamase class C family)
VKLPNFDQFYKSHHDTFELIRFFAFHPLSFEPGTKYNYSGSGYNLLGAIIEIVTNKPYKKYLEEIFFSPLGMDSTQVIDVLDYQLPNLAAGHILEKDGIKLSSKVNLSTAFSEAAIVSNILDLQKWSRNLYQGKIINRNSLKIMHKNYLQTNNNSYIGYGVFIDNNYAIKPIYQHTGRINGYQSVLIHIPERNINIIILSNVMGWEMKPQIKHIIQLLNDL